MTARFEEAWGAHNGLPSLAMASWTGGALAAMEYAGVRGRAVHFRQHAVVELAIRDLEDQALAHFPSGIYSANSAWTVIAALAHNLQCWTQQLALPGHTIRTARTLRRRLLTIPGRLVRSARKIMLRMPARWPWATEFLAALARLRALPPPA
jgi:hypothetical protein